MLLIARVMFQRRLIRAIALPIALLLLLSGVSFWQITRLLSALESVAQTNQVIAQANRTQKLLLDLETGVRGYRLTKEPEFLQPYQEASLIIDAIFAELQDLVVDDPSQFQRVNQLKSQYEEWNRLLLLGIERQQRGEVEPLAIFQLRKQQMDAMRSQITAFVAREEQLRNLRSQTALRTTQQVSVTTLALALAVGCSLAYFIRQELLQVSQLYEDILKTAIEQTDKAQRSAQRLADLHQIDQAILAAESNVTTVRDALKQLRQLVNCQQAFLALFNFETGTAQFMTDQADEALQLMEGKNLPIEDFAPIEVLQQRQIRSVQDISTYQPCPPILERLLATGLHSCLTIPMQVQGNLIGELCLAKTEGKSFTIEEQEIVHEVVEQLAIAIHQSHLRQELQDYTEKLEQRVIERTIQWQEANQELEAFNRSVAHDLKAPLRTMQGFAQALLEDNSEQLDSLGQSYLYYITEGAMQMDTLITDLLNYSRLSRAEIQIQPVDLTSVINEALEQVNAQLQERQAKVTVAAPLPQVLAHRPTLVQVVTNLLSNAIKFVKSDVLPLVNTYADEYIHQGQTWIRLWVVDNGIGIAPEHQERIFQVFERLHGIEAYPGTGIGLAIVRKGLERMGGFCGVESQLGKGSRFWIALPKAEARD
ncbi:MAG: CHASE3 domain-containing protein [Nodularia sp. CChRGM 3473]